MIKLVAFLGNYGKEYEKTRHNVSWYFEDSLPFANKISGQNKFKGEFASFTPAELSQWACDTKICSKKDGSPVLVPEDAPAHIYFLKPLTYMNLSGESVRELVDYYKVDPETELLVIYDDVSLEPGNIRIRKKGSAGGHNGIKSIIAHLGTQNFQRIKIGVGEKPKNWDLADYVLGKFSDEDKKMLEESLKNTIKATELIVMDEIDEAMNLYNRKQTGKE